MAEQRYQAVLAVISDGRTVVEVASQWGVSRQTVHAWLSRYEAEGLAGLGDRSHRPASCPHQLVPVAGGAGPRAAPGPAVLGAAADPPGAGPLGGGSGAVGVGGLPVPGPVRGDRPIYLVARRRRDQVWKRWERSVPNELWQMDVVGGFLLADGSTAGRVRSSV